MFLPHLVSRHKLETIAAPCTCCCSFPLCRVTPRVPKSDGAQRSVTTYYTHSSQDTLSAATVPLFQQKPDRPLVVLGRFPRCVVSAFSFVYAIPYPHSP